LNKPIKALIAGPGGKGYWLLGTDGGVFSFGSARFRGSAAGKLPLNRLVVQLVGMPDGNGYRMLALPITPDVSLVGMGATGAAVVDIQQRLVNRGYWLPGINGVFDANMQQAVWAFQKANRIARTGVVDGATQAAFRTAGRPRARSTSGYVVEIDKARQIILITNNGVVTRVFNTSTGTDRPYVENGQSGDAHTPEGVFTMVTQYDGLQKGPLGTLFRPKYFTWAGHAIHGSPNIPPYPASHGCARVSNAAINWMWANNVLPLGTTVWVY
jgi:lipoprotein-anchoring transpeptidase ErfK/SrfK